MIKFMKKIIFLVFFIFLFISPVIADNNSSNWGVQPLNVNPQNGSEASERVWNRENNENVYENYGSEESPAFLNRDDVDPATSEFNENYNYNYDDDPYEFDVN